MSQVARWLKAGAVAFGATGGLLGTSGYAAVDGGTIAGQTAVGPVLPAERALVLTIESGRPTVLVVTSRSEPSSQRLWENLAALMQKTAPGGWSLARLSHEDEPAQVHRLGARRFPTVLVYRKAERGLELVAHRVQPRDAAEVLEWLSGLKDPAFGRAVASPSDPAVARAGLWHHRATPSPQGPPAPAGAPAASAAAPVAAAPAPSLAAPAQAPVLISTAPPPIVLQQAPPTVYVVPPTQPANIVVLSPPPAAPSVSVVQPSSVATTAQPSLFLANANVPSVVATPAGLTASTLAAVPTGAAAPMGLAAIPAGPIGRFVGAIGDRLSRFKYPRVLTMATTTTATALAAPSTLVAAPAPTQSAVAPEPHPTGQR